MPSPLILVSIALALSLLGNAGLGKLYLGKRDELAAEKQAFLSFKAQAKQLGDAAQKKADETKAADEKRKKDADDENARTRATDLRTIAKLRSDADRARGDRVPAAPSGSKCPPEQACFDRAGLELALRDIAAGVRGLADEAAAVEADMNTARRWAQAR